MQLSEHLSVAEYIKSDTAKRKGIDNSMTAEHTENAKKLAANVFEKIRVHFNKPIYLSSGYRSKALNDAIGGSSSKSQHMTGEAMDLDQDDRGTGVSNADVFNFVKDNVEFDQLIWEYGDSKNPDWVHVSYKADGNQRKQIMKCSRVNGQPKYEPYG
jgi:zinc D-Ala-D-Ala carboxypeptidase